MPSRRSKLLAAGAAAIGVLFSGAANAQNDPNPLGPGFAFYNDPVPLPPPPPPPPLIPIPTSLPKPSDDKPQTPPPPPPLSVAWIRENIGRYLETAMNDPTPDNVRAFLSLQKIMFDRAQNFAEEASYVSQFSPALNAATYVPIDNAGNNDEIAAVAGAKTQVISSLNNKVGLWFFFKSDCDFCEKQLPGFEVFAERYHFSTLYVSMDGKPIAGLPAGAVVHQDQGQAERLGLVETPSIVMVWPPNNFVIISQGITSEDGIEDEIAKAAAYMNLVPKEILANANPYQRGVMTPPQLNALSSTGQVTPSQVSSYVNGNTLNQIQNYSGSAPYTVAPPQAPQGTEP